VKRDRVATVALSREELAKIEAYAREREWARSQAIRTLALEGLVAYSERGALGSRQESRSAPKATPPVQPGSQPPPRGTCR